MRFAGRRPLSIENPRFCDGQHRGGCGLAACSRQSAGTSGQPMEKAMSQRSKFKKCAWCGNPFPVVDGQVLQWRVDGERFACNEFCAEGVAQESTKPAAS